jgi:hypothetical protein
VPSAPTEPAAADLQELVLPDDGGERRRLADAWRERPAVLAALRHFG